MGPTPVYGATAEKPLQNADFAMKQTNRPIVYVALAATLQQSRCIALYTHAVVAEQLFLDRLYVRIQRGGQLTTHHHHYQHLNHIHHQLANAMLIGSFTIA